MVAHGQSNNLGIVEGLRGGRDKRGFAPLVKLPVAMMERSRSVDLLIIVWSMPIDRVLVEYL